VESLPLGLDPQEYWFALLFCMIASLASFYFAIHNWRRLRLIEDAATAKVRSAHQGYLELEGMGRLMDGEPIIAPLTSSHCLWYRYKIEEKQRRGDNDEWKVIKQGISDNLFYLDDETGRCVIDPDGAEVTCDDKLVWYGDSDWPMSAPLVGKGGKFGAAGRYRYSEWLILPGQPLYAIGEFRSMTPAEHYSVADITRDLIRSWKQDQAQLLKRFDGNRDGQIDHKEWELVRKVAEVQAQKEYQERAQQPQIHLLAKPADDERPFILSIYPQDQLTRRYRLWATVSLIGFFVLGSVAVWLW
jgi:hypothetical protein